MDNNIMVMQNNDSSMVSSIYGFISLMFNLNEIDYTTDEDLSSKDIEYEIFIS